MRTSRRSVVTAAAALLMAAGVAACSGAGGSTAIGNGNSSTASPAGTKVEGGTVTVAWPAAPNFIFPLVPATNSDGFNANLASPLWPNLVYEGDGAESVVNPQESLYSSLTYSNGDKTVTIVLKPWQWSDGTPITSRDFTFTYNLLKANVPNWWEYVQGLFPDDVKSVQAPSSSTIVLNLTQAYNPTFFTDDVIAEIPLLPQHAWDKESAAGKVGDYDETKSGARAVYAFLQKEGGDIATFATNPLWQVVDGPWKLKSFVSQLYVRQAIEDLINRPQIVSKIYGG
jgi:peptide/nickel transport system substrate-binding protein